jgi:ATP-dependent helicase/nuclease subunit A
VSASEIPPHVLDRQRKASDPATSAWVSANAGSGKTYVLVDRVINLLLSGEEPAKILCITFTKAAAANMATGVFRRLSRWTTLSDEALNEALRDLGHAPTASLRVRARQLFALALETPGGLKVQTIHAFCTRLLHQFPFESEVAAGFGVLDDAAERQLLEELSLAVLLEGAARPRSALGQALTSAIGAAADQTFRDLVNEVIGERDALTKWLNQAGGIEPAIAELSRTLGIDPADTAAAVEDEFFSQSLIPEGEWPALIEILSAGAPKDREHIARLRAAQAASGRTRVSEYLKIFCTQEQTRRVSFVSKKIQKAAPELYDRLMDEQERVCALLDRLRAVDCRTRTQTLVTVADAVLRRYRAEKDRRGVLDYDDLIDKTLALLERGAAAWVHYKLDLGINHVLIDEAQDTSPQQWEVIRHLVSEFTAGESARRQWRTLFAVGDDKQSIFSFQGADPLRFGAMRSHFENAFVDAELTFRRVELTTSFRSGAIVLGAVDTVFARPEAYEGLTADPVKTVHEWLPAAAPGIVEIWEPIKPKDKAEIEAWDAPFDTQSEVSTQVQLARKIACHVELWQRHGTRPGDILVLVRQRGPLFEAIIRALKQRSLPVAGADRLVLTEHIAVMDLMVLADALLLPADDLALATVLKSPLFGLDEESLFKLAWNRGKRTLRESLVGKAAEDPRFAEAAQRIEQLADAARRESPFTFYARLLGPGEGRKRFLARLGSEANDALDEFLNLALAYESRETPSLQGFIAWLRAACAEVKRDMEMDRDEVRVMTVHGAKGLEAPIVILADTMTPPAGFHPPRLVVLPARDGVPGVPAALVWINAKRNDNPVLANARAGARQATENEYRRLLYVAMTRAKERLVVCGAAGHRSAPKGCWYDLVYDALKDELIEVPPEDGDEEITLWRFRKADAPAASGQNGTDAAVASVLPMWLAQPVPRETRRVVPVRPSDAVEEAGTGARAELDSTTARMRGRVVHRLLQSLPDLPPDRRMEAARAHVSSAVGDLPASEQDKVIADVFAILGHAQLAPLFAPGTRAEVPVVGRLPGPGNQVLAVAGQVDRLAVTADAVLIADYKTNRPAPRRLEDVPPQYRRQLALYRALLSRIYPDRPVRTALVWTETPEIMEIPAAMLDAEIAGLTSP